MTTRRAKTPPEKKALSRTKDRRNTFRENSKASRTAIPRRKRSVARTERRAVAQTLSGAQSAADEVQDRVPKRKSAWRKDPDTPLGKVVERKLARRKRLGMQ